MAKVREQQKQFADYYIELGNTEQAALKAGYSEKYARAQSYKLLANVGIKSYIDDRLKQLEDLRIADAVEVMKYLTSVLREEVDEDVVVVEGEGDGCSSARIIRKAVGIRDRNKAAELLAKRYGLLTDNIHLTGDVGVTIVNDIPKDTG